MHLLALLPVLLLLAAHTQAYKILCIFGLPSNSHNTLGKGVVDSLLSAGHEVTWATAFPEKAKSGPNLHIIDVSSTRELVQDKIDMTKQHNDFVFLDQFAKNLSRYVANTKALREVLVDQQFDAVVNEWFFTDVDAGYAAIQQAPWIVLSGIILHPHMEHLVDEVRSVTTTPMFLLSSTASAPMTFTQRVSNVLLYGLMWLNGIKKESALASQYEQQFGPLAAARGVPLPPLKEARHNISILFVNSHPSISTANVLPPNVVEVAGYHISEKTAPLPKDLQDILDSSKQGFVYFSMGSVLKSAWFPESTRKALLQVFEKLPYTVLWKFEEQISGLPKNVHVRPWFPQPSVLAHPNVKVFITHGGQLSSLEAIRYGVPLLAVPVFGDQPSNAERAVNYGYAKMVPFSEHMAADISVALKEILANDRYYKRAKHLSKLFNKRPVPPSKLISDYVELAIESKGAYHLRSPSQLYAWHERWMLDAAALLLVLLYLIKFVLTRLYRRLFRTEAKKKAQGKAKKN